MNAIAYTNLGSFPTPIERMAELEKFCRSGVGLWVKRDDISGKVYGGNKVRKLEFILGEALSKDIRAIATSGARGSHHITATCLYGKKLGLKVGGVMFFVKGSDYLEESHQRLRRCLDWEIVVRSPLFLQAGFFIWERKAAKSGYGKLARMVIPAGGSCSSGVVGYISCGLEIEQQRKQLSLPEFDYVFVPLGTGGTVCGLAYGFAICGSKSRCVGVRVTSPLIANVFNIKRLLGKTERFLRDKASDEDRKKIPSSSSCRIIIDGNYVSGGYGKYGSEEIRIIDELKQMEGLELDPVYSAKAMRCFITSARQRMGKNLLFIATHSSVFSETAI